MDPEFIFNTNSQLPGTRAPDPEHSLEQLPHPAAHPEAAYLPLTPGSRTYSTFPTGLTLIAPQTYSTIPLHPQGPPTPPPLPTKTATELSEDDPAVKLIEKALEGPAMVSEEHVESIKRSADISAQAIADNAATVHSIETKGAEGLESAEENYKRKQEQVRTLRDQQTSGLDNLKIGGPFDDLKGMLKNLGFTDWKQLLPFDPGPAGPILKHFLKDEDYPIETEGDRSASENKEALIHATVGLAQSERELIQKRRQNPGAAEQMASAQKPGGDPRAADYMAAVLKRLDEIVAKLGSESKGAKDGNGNSDFEGKPLDDAKQKAAAEAKKKADEAKAAEEAKRKANDAKAANDAARAQADSRPPPRMSALARLVDARTGVGEVMRLATMAGAHEHGGHGGGTQLHDELKAMHGTMRDAYLKSTEAAWRAKFSRRDHR